MKNKKYYTFILTSNSTKAPKKISVSQKQVNIALGLCAGLFVGLIATLMDYSGLATDQLELTNLRKTNQSFKQEITEIKSQFRTLKEEVVQLQDFSHKVRLITTGSDKPSSYGKVSSQASLMALTSPALSRKPSSVNKTSQVKKELQNPEVDLWTNKEFIVHIERLKKKSKLVKQEVWDIYSSLLERKEVLNNTPSIVPTQGWITSHFGYRNETLYVSHEPDFHRGMDIAANIGSPVFATGEGKVTYTGYDEHGFGKLVVIDHGYNLKTYYAHLSQIKTSPGAYVKRGQPIGYVGNTGKSTGPHLHYEVRILGIPVNPINYILDGADSSRSISYNH